MKTLYVSDLDGTLLRSDETISDYTIDTLTHLIDKGMLFSYATARSYHTAHKVTQGFNVEIPIIVYNGTMIKDNVTGKILAAQYFDASIQDVLNYLIEHQVYPIVYAMIDHEEKFSYVENMCNQATLDFIHSRKGDIRSNPVEHIEDLYKGNIFYITCIGDKNRLYPIYQKYKDVFHCIYQEDFYSQEQWLEFLPLQASKSNAIKQLKTLLECDKVVVFGDGKNDIDMFENADECYAVENAVDELKTIATQVIGHHNEDGVAKFLKKLTM